MKRTANLIGVAAILIFNSIIGTGFVSTAETLSDRVRIVDSGSDTSFDKPFVYIARTADAFDALAELRPSDALADLRAGIDFDKQALVAVFAGRRNTGGYSVKIEEVEGSIRASVVSPPDGAMVTKAITGPYSIALVSAEEELPLELALSPELQDGTGTFCVERSEFRFAGGFAGMEREFRAEGVVRIWERDGLLTAQFDLTGSGNDGHRKLAETASGTLNEADGMLGRVETGGFIDRPHPPMIVRMVFDESGLVASFKPGKRSYVVNDGFEGEGKLQASSCEIPAPKEKFGSVGECKQG